MGQMMMPFPITELPMVVAKLLGILGYAAVWFVGVYFAVNTEFRQSAKKPSILVRVLSWHSMIVGAIVLFGIVLGMAVASYMRMLSVLGG